MNASTVTGVVTGGLLGAVADAPWWGSCAVFLIVLVTCYATQLVNAWNTLLRGPHERRALREAQPAEVLAYFSATPTTGTPADPPTETPGTDPPAGPGTA